MDHEEMGKIFYSDQPIEPSKKYEVYGLMLGYFPDMEFTRYAKAVIKEVANEFELDYLKLQHIAKIKSKFNPFYFKILGAINTFKDSENLIEWGIMGIKVAQARRVGFDTKLPTVLLEPELCILYTCKYISDFKLKNIGINPYDSYN